ncbi:hypothetical protein AtNW77_Chr2g0239091 [Arabidopsis thaliana]|uniref:Transmembrane protein n=2 Tax=Arabidopsis TaxID=3701 RepID=A0A178VZ95_ARATH|nr:hypothetical protein ISN45_At02g014720 [Arabidopsis thaliana x Arabidopsis arenosa]OAP11174.1 hypothetical protein AXX17_AT2G16420 [Arabidopsis thaliana]
MNKVEEEEKKRRLEANGLFWTERLFLFLLVIFPTYLLDLIIPIILATTLFALPFFFFCTSLSSVGPSGIGKIWLFILDRSTFYLAYEYYKLLDRGFELTFLWRLTVFLSVVIHSIYMFEHFLRSHQVVPPPPPPQSKSDETPGEVREQVEKMKELVEDGKKRVTVMQNIIHSVLETQRKEWGEFLDELSKDGKKTMTELDGMICSQIGTLRDNMRLNVDEIWQELRDELRSKVDEDIKASRQDLNKDVKSVADQLRETYLAVQETIKEAKTHETYLINQNNRRVIRGEDVEGFTERSKCNNWRLRRRLPQRSSQVRRWSWWRQGSSNGRRTTSTILLPSVTCISIISSLFIGLYCV